MSVAVYAGSFDPMTSGHLSVVRQAAGIFSFVRILVAINPNKRTLFTSEERVGLIRKVVAAMPHVSVDATSGLVVDYAREIGAQFLVRGIRGASDATFETELAHENRKLAPEIASVFLAAEPALSELSSSELKRRAQSGEDVAGLCPPVIAAALRARLAESVVHP